MRTLAGKWAWVWNWRRCAQTQTRVAGAGQGEVGDGGGVAERLKASGCVGALVKAFDGAYWFDQGMPWREVSRALRERGVGAGGWGYCYGNDPAAEAQRAVETAQYGEADLLVLDVEAEFKSRPEAAEELCARIREALGPDYPLYFSSFAIARYHKAFPFEVFERYCTGAAPQVYWNAFRWPLAQSLGWTYEDYATLGIRPERLFPVGGLYQEGLVRFPEAEEVRAFIRDTGARGSSGLSFWSYEHMSDEMWQAVRGEEVGLRPDPRGGPEEEDEMSSEEFAQVSRSLGELSGRVERLEGDVNALRSSVAAAQAAPPPLRTYTVQPGDTLSGIAAHFGLPDWRRFYEANAGTIGADPDRIYPGQVLVVP